MAVGMDPYTVFKAGDCPVAGLVAKPPEGQASCRPAAWTSCVTVGDVDARTARAADAGGAVIVAPVDVPTAGRDAGSRENGLVTPDCEREGRADAGSARPVH